MDKSWTRESNTFSESYIKGVESFLKFAKENVDAPDNIILCPCTFCNNTRSKSFDDVKRDLHINGFSYNYTEWIFHGERSNIFCDDDENINENQNMMPELSGGLDDLLADMAEVQQEDGETESFIKLCGDAKRELYPGCKKSLLTVVVKLLHIKVRNKWSNKSFDMLLKFLKKILPEGHTLPTSYYAAKTMLDEMGMGYEEIEVCKNDCALFFKEYKGKEICPICNEPRWKFDDGKGNKIPYKVMRHFPLKPRLQRLFMSSQTAANMRWHKEKRKEEVGIMRHPADSPAWKHFDTQYPQFAQDSRNVRLGLATDGFTPWSNLGNSYSMWPVILVSYNLPSYQFMKEEFLMMSLLIPGPRSPGKDIDVYLRPLIDELKELWDIGVETYDVYSEEKFQLHATLLWTISDFPAYGSISGWVTMGRMACPCCFDQTRSTQVRSKTAFIGHRCFLDRKHSWRFDKIAFNGEEEHRKKPKELSGNDVLHWLDRLSNLFGKPGKHPEMNRKRKRAPEQANWVKKSVFFELPYWHNLMIRHNLDVMHIEKNICDNIMGTLLDIKGKTKDTEKAREDLRDWGIRNELHMRVRATDNKPIKPVACYTLSSTEKDGFCKFLKSIKFPDGYAANISSCIKENRISGLKSHDCHVLLQRLIPAGIRGYLNTEVNDALYELGDFFKELCSKTLKVKDVEKLEKNIPVILCKLEKIFPPAFFTVMVHLAVHLPREAKIAGPVHARWMYPIERNLGSLKKFVRNRARPEASIAEGYIVKESLTFISMYLTGIETRFNQRRRNEDGSSDGDVEELSVFSMRTRPFGNVRLKSIKSGLILSDEDLIKAHLFILRNCEEVEKYMKVYKAKIQGTTIQDAESSELSDTQMKQFPEWFKKHVNVLHHKRDAEATDGLWALANGPFNRETKYYTGCMVNEVRFHTKDHEVHRRTQNSGLVVEGEHKNHMMEFFGFLTSVVELTYLGNRKVVLFQCEWFDTGNRKTMKGDKHFISIDVRSRWYKQDPFVLPVNVKQVFYINDTKLGKNWQLVQRVQHRHLWDLPKCEENDDDTDDSCAQIPMQQFESNGVIEVGEDDGDDVVNGLVREVRIPRVEEVNDDNETAFHDFDELNTSEDGESMDVNENDSVDSDELRISEDGESIDLNESEDEDYHL